MPNTKNGRYGWREAGVVLVVGVCVSVLIGYLTSRRAAQTLPAQVAVTNPNPARLTVTPRFVFSRETLVAQRDAANKGLAELDAKTDTARREREAAAAKVRADAETKARAILSGSEAK